MHRPVGGRLPALDQTRRTANKHAGADGEDALGALRLSPDPAEHVLILHQRFLTETARYVHHVELWSVGDTSGDLDTDGRHSTNTSGGLASKGHPVGATGCGQIHEIIHQLRGTAEKRQVKDPKIGMTHNGGGILGVDAAAMAIHIFKK